MRVHRANLMLSALVTAVLFIAMAGCTPRVIVRSHPTPQDKGIRYYRPKPYLKIEPAEVAIEKNQTTIVPGIVRISLVYLPDFSEEYAIDVRSGLGIANVGIKLQDGWNLTEISQELDSQADENVKAAASLISAVGDVLPTSAGRESATDVSFTVAARNVPIGFYESIVGSDARGCKRLYGFRYVGFVPFSSCPLDVGGCQQACCGDPTALLYGLIFQDGQMVFQPLDNLVHTPVDDPKQPSERIGSAQRSTANAAMPQASSDEDQGLPLPAVREVDLGQLSIQLRAHLFQLFGELAEIRATRSADSTIVSIRVDREAISEQMREASLRWLTQNYGTGFSFDIELDVAEY